MQGITSRLSNAFKDAINLFDDASSKKKKRKTSHNHLSKTKIKLHHYTRLNKKIHGSIKQEKVPGASDKYHNERRKEDYITRRFGELLFSAMRGTHHRLPGIFHEIERV